MTEKLAKKIPDLERKEEKEGKTAVFNKYWNDPNFKIKMEGSLLNLRECYEIALQNSKNIFEKQKQLTNEYIPEGKFILYVNNVLGGPVSNLEMDFIDRERYGKMMEAETGYKDTKKEDFQKANMMHCLGFEKEDTRFKEFKSFNHNVEDLDLTDCVGVVMSGSEIDVLDETDPKKIEATEKVRKIIRKSDALNIPMLGICFGGQLLANENGADITWLKDNKGEKTRSKGLNYIRKTEHSINNELLNELKAIFYAIQNHGQQIDKGSLKKNNVKVLAENPENPAPEVIVFGKNKISLQFHPEVGNLRVDVVMSMSTDPANPTLIFQTDIYSTKEIFFRKFMEMAGEFVQENNSMQARILTNSLDGIVNKLTWRF